MVDRILLDAAAGQLRVSKPGVDVKTADDFGLIFREYASGLIPGVIGSVVVPASGDVTVPLPEGGYVPIVHLRNVYANPDGSLYAVQRNNPYDSIAADKQSLLLRSTGAATTVRYFMFRNRQF